MMSHKKQRLSLETTLQFKIVLNKIKICLHTRNYTAISIKNQLQVFLNSEYDRITPQKTNMQPFSLKNTSRSHLSLVVDAI